MVTPIKQINCHACALACIESLSIDKSKHITQQQLIDKYPDLCLKGTEKEGSLDFNDVFPILKDLQLCSSKMRSMGKPFILVYHNNVENGIFLCTMFSEDGKQEIHHCWRINKIFDFGISVVEPRQNCPPTKNILWGLLEIRQCIVEIYLPFHHNIEVSYKNTL